MIINHPIAALPPSRMEGELLCAKYYMLIEIFAVIYQFNNFIVNIGPKLATDIQNTGKIYFYYLHNKIPSSMFMKPIDKLEIIKMKDKFNPNRSTDHNNIGYIATYRPTPP